MDLARKQKLVKSGGSTIIAIPPDFLRDTNLEAGDVVLVTYNNKALRVRPLEASGETS